MHMYIICVYTSYIYTCCLLAAVLCLPPVATGECLKFECLANCGRAGNCLAASRNWAITIPS